ncbi:lipid transfer-like protein vas [Hordeum vulgare]|nr:lipid transfer-like protein vas [Hordeum vulgare]
MLLVASVLVAGAATQSSRTPECASKLVGCASSMNNTDAQMPPETCCSLLREAIKNGRAYACSMPRSRSSRPSTSTNTDALRLSKRCRVTQDISSYPSNSTVPLHVLLSRNFYRMDQQNLDVKSWTRWLAMKSVEASLVLDAFIFPTPDALPLFLDLTISLYLADSGPGAYRHRRTGQQEGPDHAAPHLVGGAQRLRADPGVGVRPHLRRRGAARHQHRAPLQHGQGQGLCLD